MKYETMLDGAQLPVLGLGTWPMGGGSAPDYSRDEEMVPLIRRLIRMGYTHIDTAESYGGNHTEELVGRAIEDFDRSEVFVTTKVSPEHLRYAGVINALHGSLRRLRTDYVDLYLIHWPNRDIPLKDTFRALNELVAAGYVKRVGVSNFDCELLQEAMDLSATPIVTNQVHYNLLRRECVENGVLAFCQEHGILLTAYSPLKDDVLGQPVLAEIARSQHVTPAQAAIAWLLNQPKVITIPKSSNEAHARDNLAAADLALGPVDMDRLNNLENN